MANLFDAITTACANTAALIKEYVTKPSADGALNYVYPVGSIYMSTNATDPAELFGGSWERIKDTFLLSAGDTYAAGATGGEAEHKLTVNEMPSHTHSYSRVSVSTTSVIQGDLTGKNIDDVSTSTTTTASTGKSQAHNNMPPYLAVYVWKRTA